MTVDVVHTPTPSEAPSQPALDRALAELQQNKERWLRLPVGEKVGYAKNLLDGFRRTAAGQVAAALEAKGLPADSPLAGEEWVGGPFVALRTLRLLIRGLEQIDRHGTVPIDPSSVHDVGNSQVAVRVFPDSLLDRLLYSGFYADVWLEEGVTRANLQEHVGGVYSETDPRPAVALVLGAGNVASIGALDAVHKLFWEGQVALLKLNPVNDYLEPFVEDAFGELIRDGFFRIARGGAETGAYLCSHPAVDNIHITGSERTHDLIVFGAGEEGRRRKAENRPRLDKPITSELGNVSPVILVPGDWSAAELRFQAENVATQMVQNGGFNCNAAKILVTSRHWPQREAFFDALQRVLAAVPRRPAYYPGATDRFQQFVDAYPQAQPVGRRAEGVVPPTLIRELDAGDPDQLAFTTESFCAVTGEVALDEPDTAAFLESAVEFCNESLRGTLNAEVVIDPRTEAELGDSVSRAAADLRYGAVAFNHWPALVYAFGSTPWGAFPGHTLADIQSGIGHVHNAAFLNRPQKTVAGGPFRVFPKPPWFVTHRNAHRVGPLLIDLEAKPSLARIPALALATLRG